MRDGTSIQLSVTSPKFGGETLPTWISGVKGLPSDLDASAVLFTDTVTGIRSLRIAVVNRSEKEAYEVPLRIAFEKVTDEIEVHELWHADVKARNGWGHENEVCVKSQTEKWTGGRVFREHSFTLLVLNLV